MKINLISVGNRMPHWLEEGFQTYIQRLPDEYKFKLIEIPPAKRSTTMNTMKALEQEAAQILKHVQPQDHVIALTIEGTPWSTPELAQQLRNWRNLGRTISLIIGGAEGLGLACLQRAETRWSLSKLTFPHLLVRLLIAEQIYRAHTIISGHPYHKE